MLVCQAGCLVEYKLKCDNAKFAAKRESVKGKTSKFCKHYLVGKKAFTPFGIPGCKPEATLVPETGVAAAQHI